MDKGAFLNPLLNTLESPRDSGLAASIGPHGNHIRAVPLHMVGSIMESRDMDELANPTIRHLPYTLP